MKRAPLPLVLALSVSLAGIAAPVPVMAEGDPVTVVQRHVDAYRSGDMDRFLGTFTPDAVVVVDGRMFAGRDQIRAVYRANFAPGAPRVYIRSSWASGNQIGAEEGYVFADGTDMCCSISTYTVEQGRIIRIDVTSPR